MSLKIHFLHFHLDFLLPNMGEISDEHGKRFHQDIKEIENRYQGRITKDMLADNCKFLHRESDTMYKRQAEIKALVKGDLTTISVCFQSNCNSNCCFEAKSIVTLYSLKTFSYIKNKSYNYAFYAV